MNSKRIITVITAIVLTCGFYLYAQAVQNVPKAAPVKQAVVEQVKPPVQGPPAPVPAPAPAQQPIVIKEFVKLGTPDTEVGDAIIFLEDEELVNPLDRPYIKFFTTYAIREQSQRESTMLALSFIAHSMIGVNNEEFTGGGYYPIAKVERQNENDKPTFVPVRLVPGSKTLWWIDIRDFNWTEQTWERMMTTQGYMVEPIISHEKNGALRLLSGNSVVRADWFVNHSSALTHQADVGSKIEIYKDFLYGTLKAPPKNVTEFEKTWGIDTIKARNAGRGYSTLVTKSKAVARHNRIMWGYRTEDGWYYRTYDVNHMQGLRDYGENYLAFKGHPPHVFDGGEIFATNTIQMQVYDLYNAQESTQVAFGDPTLVRHATDVINDPRVRTPHSCYDCHAAGPVPSENSLLEFLNAGLDVKIYDKKDLLRIKRTALDGKFEDSIKENQVAFANSLLKINGLKPEENIKAYLDTVTWYNKPLDLKQAAFECGVSEEAFKEAMGPNNKTKPYKVPFRIGLMLAGQEDIPREVWESPGQDGQPGLFQQAMIIIHGLTIITDTQTVENIITIQKDTNIYAQDGKTVVGSLKAGFKIKEAKDAKAHGGWIGVKLTDGRFGYIKQ